MDMIVRGARVFAADGERTADVGMLDGAVAAIDAELGGPAGEEVDARGLVALPGAVDPHVHLNDPGRAEWEGFATGTRALAAGGTTCCVDMPLNALPPTLDRAGLDAKVAAARGAAHVDVALWGGLVPGDMDRLDELAALGVVGFKAFMSATGTPEFERADDLTLLDGMARAARLGLPVAVHAESDAITAGLAARAPAAGRTTMRDYLASRPVVAEVEAIGRAVALAEETGCALHVVHVSSGRGVAAISRARARGVDVTCETCPHFLVLDEDDAAALGAVAKCAPPLRPRAEADALWTQLAGGEIDLVASDHSPAPPALRAGEDMFAAWGGIAGAQLLLALVWSEGAAARGLRPARGRPAVRDRGGRALRARPGQGRAARRGRRRPRARRPRRRVDGGRLGAARPSSPQPLSRPAAARARGAHVAAGADDRAGRRPRRGGDGAGGAAARPRRLTGPHAYRAFASDGEACLGSAGCRPATAPT
jgi:allantoinase